MPEYVLILMSLLAIGFAGVRVATALRVPHSALLVVLGVAAGLLFHHVPGQWTQWFPDLVFYVLLPPLIFESSFHLDPAQLRRDWLPVSALAVFSLFLSTFCIGFALRLLFGFPLLPSLTFGALISATDPVAVVALFKEVGAPRRLNTLIEGESLLNDGTAMILFRTLLALSLPAAMSRSWPVYATADLLWVGAGSVAFGLLFSFATRIFLRTAFLSGAAQLGVTVVSAYMSFVLADSTLHLSGVIATLVVGLVLGSRARLELNAAAFAGIRQTWEFLALAANTLVFFAVGLSVNPFALAHVFRFIPLTLAVVYLARALSVYGVIPAVNRTGLARPIGWPYQTVLVWGGLRGGLALALVLTLPVGYADRDLFVSLATSVVIATLLVNAVTTGRVLSILKLDQLEPSDRGFYLRAIKLVQASLGQALGALTRAGDFSPQVVRQTEERIDALETGGDELAPQDEERFGAHSLLMAERGFYDERLRAGVLSRQAYVQLVDWVDDRIDAYADTGLEGLAGFAFTPRSRAPALTAAPARINRLLERMTVDFEILLTLKLALEEREPRIERESLRAICASWVAAVRERLSAFHGTYGHYTAAVQSFFVASATQGGARAEVSSLLGSQVISPAVGARVLRDLDELRERIRADSLTLLRPSWAYLVARLPFLKEIPRALTRKIAESGRSEVYPAGRVIAREGDVARSLFIVVAGQIENRSRSIPPVRLLQGDYFGEEAFLGETRYRRTSVSLSVSELLELDFASLRLILQDYPRSLDLIRKAIQPQDDSGHQNS